MSKSLKKLIDINRLREFKNKLVGTDSAYVQTAAVDQTIAGTKTFSKPIAGSVTGSSGSCTGNAASATKATKDAAGNTITTTYATKAENNTKANDSEVVHKSGNETIAGTKTFSNGVLSTNSNALMAQCGSYTLVLRNDGGATYLLMSDKDGVPGTWSSARPLVIDNATGVCNINGNAVTATTATTAKACTGNAATATKATQDSAGQQINTTYIKGLAVSGRIITYTKGDGSTGTITTQDTNTWTAFKGATSSANGTAGYVPAPTKGNQDKFFKADGTWATPPNTTYASMSASEATTGTATAARTISAKVLHDKINSLMVESILSMVYPVGSVYISVNDVSPEKFLGGTWIKISQGRVLQGASGTQTAGTEVSAGLPNISVSANGEHTHTRGSMNITGGVVMHGTNACTAVNGSSGAFYGSGKVSAFPTPYCNSGASSEGIINFSADRTWTGSTSSAGAHSHDAYITGITGNSTTVQPPALLVNIWKRTA